MSKETNHLISPYFDRLEGPRTEGAKALYAYWQSLGGVVPGEDGVGDCSGGGGGDASLPKRGQIRMEELARIDCVDSIFILEPTEDGEDWRYRLLGTRIVAMYGSEVTNLPLRQHMTKEEADIAIALSNEVRDTRKPLFLTARFVSGDHIVPIETMSLPILGQTGEIWLFGGTFFTSS